jgi:hypothetical protein
MPPNSDAPRPTARSANRGTTAPGALPGYPLDDLAVLHHWVRNFSPRIARA